jgi:hypothetical protein
MRKNKIMAKGGHRYPLVIYTRMMDRWWSPIFVLGLALLGLAWALYSWDFEDWRWLVFASIGVLCVFLGPLLLVFRKGAYIQPSSDHFRLVTPFLRLNVSYKRFLRASSVNVGSLFPPNSVPKWQAEIIQPIAKMTAVVIELRAYPMSQSVLRAFLSPLFFKDKTPHFVILVDDWMKLSTEIESMRSGSTGPAVPRQRRDNSILSRLPNKDQ